MVKKNRILLENKSTHSHRDLRMAHVFLSDDLIVQVLSLLTIKSLMRFKSVSKQWKTLISDPTFVKLHLHVEHQKNIWFRIWNPATKTISKRLRSSFGYLTPLRYTFCYDNSTTTYKVVVLFPTHQVKILNLRDNSWRTISSFPPFHHVTPSSRIVNQGVYLSGTVNWFAIQTDLSIDYYHHRKDITVDQFVIISLDLATETYMKLSPPRGVDEVPHFEPIITVLMDCLCFSHTLNLTHFVIWKMTEFGVEQSWTQFLKISYQNLQVDIRFGQYGELRFYQLIPLCLSENGHTLIFENSVSSQLILYDLRDNRAEVTCDNKINWFLAKNYVESVASIC
ncbi:F-box protein CPR1-like [Trifolium pratense]|uniref:F-box protein CPR1-like n=1 Tax=Trifolium pratense TaxID=57577 RepID=UPI001E693EA9|nr:F-box protein CPR1-like [Trifolium pratense]